MNSLAIEAGQTERGIEILFRGSKYVLEYPDDIWRQYPKSARDILFDNLVYAETIHLPLTHKTDEIIYNTSPPYFQPYFFQNMVMDLPSCANVDGTSTAELVKAFMNMTVYFKDQDIKFPNHVEETQEDSSVVSISFGKDSLLTWAVCREMGLNPQLCYVVEPLLTYEEKHKMIIAERFHKEFGVNFNKIVHSVGKLRDGLMLGLGETEIGWGLQSTEYALMILPVAHKYGARYILMGNEQSCTEYYYDGEGFVCYPAYDQSHIWTKQIDSMTRQLTGGGTRYLSVIEPLNDIAVVYALYERYPEVAKHHMSCFVETEAGRDHHWCLNCSVCSKMYLLIKASGFDPATVGLTRNMFSKECRDYYSLFGGTSVNTYALTGRGRDEQLFGFYLAWKNGDRSDLVQEFEKRFLDEARDREDELYKTFFGLHESITMPQHIEEKAMSIYKEVFSDLP